MPKISFSNLFKEYSDGTVESKSPLRIGKTLVVPGIRFSEGTTFDGINILLFKGRNFEIKVHKGIKILEGVWSQ